jgi:2-C-methyl-D-erythritol 4-phosphate cytidylyltransferase
MGAGVPKQYLELGGRLVIEHSVGRLLSHPAIRGVVVVLGPEDSRFGGIEFGAGTALLTAVGGEERCHSVLNGLRALEGRARHRDRVLVHDAVRPCVRREDIDRLIALASERREGGLLGLPVRDTLKRTGADARVEATLPRDRLWHAHTPQLFPLGTLLDAMERAVARGQLVTDEAGAMELAGFAPLMVEGHSDNIKITRPEDLALAELFLAAQARAA